MRKTIKKFISLLLMIPMISISLTSSAETDLSLEEQLPYKQFSLIEASKLDIPPYPFGDEHTLTENDNMIARYQEWWRAKHVQQDTEISNFDELLSFTKESARLNLANAGDQNTLYSPINIWLYLELLSNLTEGESHAQVRSLLGQTMESDPGLAAEALYKALYWDDGMSIYRPASSLWIDRRVQLSEPLAAKLATQYHTSVFQGPMGEQIFDESFRAWLNEQTNGILENIVNELRLENTGISLCTTLYLHCPWSLPFNKDETYTDVFYTNKGETSTDFMRTEQAGGTVYRGAGFSSIIMDLQDGGYVTFVLPDADKDMDSVLQSDNLYEYLFSGREWEDRRNGKVKITMPRIDILTATSLRETLIPLGVTDIFDPEKTEFSKDITSDDHLKLSSAEQYARLIMDEDGVEAASIIVSDSAFLRIPNEEEIVFTLNRPFIFAVFSETNIPLFFGTYNTPSS